MSSQQCVITVVLQPGFNLRGLLHNDRFLVMCLPMKDTQMTTQELAEFWKVSILFLIYKIYFLFLYTKFKTILKFNLFIQFSSLFGHTIV